MTEDHIDDIAQVLRPEKGLTDQTAKAVITENDPMDEIAEAVAKGKCILFLGAAVHRAPPKDSTYAYAEVERPPVGSAFSRHLASSSNFAKDMPGEDVMNLQRVSQYFELATERSELNKQIKAAVFTGKKPSPVVRALSELNFPVVITTNYDRLFEAALRKNDKDPFVSVYQKNEIKDKATEDFPFDEDFSETRPFVFKMHGDIEEPDSIVITDEDYIHFILRMTDTGIYDPIPKTLQVQFKRWPTLFIGYSLKDYNLRVLFRTLRWKIDRSGFPRTYSIDLYPDPLIKTVWGDRGRFVSFIAQDVWTFVPELYRRIKKREMPP
jgi:TorA maturation chaperone TorD